MIQNMTWNGAQGFQSKPTAPFFVPYHDDPQISTIAGAGVFGTTHTERGLTYVGVDLSGHMVSEIVLFMLFPFPFPTIYENCLWNGDKRSGHSSKRVPSQVKEKHLQQTQL